MNSNFDNSTVGAIEAANVERLADSLRIDANPHARTRWERRLASTWGAGNREPWREGQCIGCAQPCDTSPTEHELFGSRVLVTSRLCEDCGKLAEQHYHRWKSAPEIEATTPSWDAKCPPKFREAILAAELPRNVDRAAFNKVVAWRMNLRGLALIGASGSGKSTAFWALARQLELVGEKPIILSGVELGRSLSSAAREIEEAGLLKRCRILMVDDFAKEKPTASIGSLMWELLDHRHNYHLPLIMTTRFSGDALRERFSEPYLGDDIRRRLNELCSPVYFNLPEK